MTDFLVTDSQPVDRWFGKLIVPAKGFMGKRLAAGNCPFIADHDDRKLCGQVREYRLEGDNLIVTVPDDARSVSGLALDVWPDIDSGVRPGISPGVMIEDISVLSGPYDEILIVLAEEWDADEISTVTMPANPMARKLSVGGDGAEGLETLEGLNPVLLRETLSVKAQAKLEKFVAASKVLLSQERKETEMPEETAQEQGQGAGVATASTSAIELMELATQHGKPDLGIKFAREGKTRGDLLEALLSTKDADHKQALSVQTQVPPASAATVVDATPVIDPKPGMSVDTMMTIMKLGVEHAVPQEIVQGAIHEGCLKRTSGPSWEALSSSPGASPCLLASGRRRLDRTSALTIWQITCCTGRTRTTPSKPSTS